ncbi:hypothetical protein PR048_019031 [Dryococelus australis]|uniref:Uncharacterized protein n=1 Tax=Dryococelus australis TaxID=614101 RepID=A0ABQ9H2P2_9NEOP|nr:hypothetical protein PR048_019031 [Dryococelus australis]
MVSIKMVQMEANKFARRLEIPVAQLKGSLSLHENKRFHLWKEVKQWLRSYLKNISKNYAIKKKHRHTTFCHKEAMLTKYQYGSTCLKPPS